MGNVKLSFNFIMILLTSCYNPLSKFGEDIRITNPARSGVNDNTEEDSSIIKDDLFSRSSSSYSRSSSSSSSSSSPSKSTPRVGVSCKPVRKYSYTLQSSSYLGHQSTSVFDVAVPDKGWAVARFTGLFENTAEEKIYSWNSNVYVGESKYSQTAADDICPRKTVSKTNMGYGKLTTSGHNVQVTAGDIYPKHHGTAPKVKVLEGSTLEVWVEDENCPQSQIQVASYYGSAGFHVPWVWPNNTTAVHMLSIEKPRDVSGSLLAFSVAEGSPMLNPNKICGQESATLVSEIYLNNSPLIQKTEAIPASQGQGHLVMALSKDIALSALPEKSSLELRLGSNIGTTVTTSGGCCGDAMLASVLLTDASFTLQPLPEDDGLGEAAWCGFQGYLAGNRVDTLGLQGDSSYTPSLRCKGVNIASGCPRGYKQLYFGTLAWHDDSIADQVHSCVKDTKLALTTQSTFNLGGQFCGASIRNFGKRDSTWINSNPSDQDIKCLGAIPIQACPSGYKKIYWANLAWGDDNSADYVYSCIRDSNESVSPKIENDGSFCGVSFLNNGTHNSVGIVDSSGKQAPPSFSIKCKDKDIATQGCPAGYHSLKWSTRSYHADSESDSVSTCIKSSP